MLELIAMIRGIADQSIMYTHYVECSSVVQDYLNNLYHSTCFV